MIKTVALRLLSAIGLLLFAAAVVYVYHWKAGLIALAVMAVVGVVLAYVLPGELFRFLVRRVVLGLITIWVIVSLVFVLFYVALPDPARQYAGRAATPEEIQNVKIELGLDKPIPTQYVNFINDDLHGNLRTSFVSGHASVNTTIAQAIPVDISLAVGSALLFILLGISVGVLAARHPRSWLDRGATVFVLTGISMPTFILGLLLLLVFYYLLTINHIAIFPPGGTYDPFQLNSGWGSRILLILVVAAVVGLVTYILTRTRWVFFALFGAGIVISVAFGFDWGEDLLWAHDLILPWITLAMITAATYSRLSRSSLLDTLGEDYIRTARAKGLSERRVVYRHALRSALSPIVTQFGIDVATTLGGAIITEQVFSLPGLGFYVVRAISNQDFPLIEGVVLCASVFIVAANILVDAAYALLDPRVRVS